MSNILISSVNYVDTGTATVDNAVSTLPITNLQDRQLVKIWRNSQKTAVINVDFGAAKIIDFAALVKHNISQTGTIRWRFSNASDFSTTVYDSGFVKAWSRVEEFGTLPWGVFSWGGFINPSIAVNYAISSFDIQASAVAARYMRIDISDNDNTDNYLQAGRLIAGPAYQPSINYSNGVQFEFMDDSRITKSRGGQTFIDEVERYRRIRFELVNIPQAEIFDNVFNNLDRLRGTSQDILVIPQPNDSTTWLTQNIYGRVTRTSPLTNTALNFYSKFIEVEELI
tara:strand:+ start:209 stop:1057 length:849 start_codon:yes stop_codon:yes gene_type:complete